MRTKLIAKLSKGYRQRVGLAQAILHNPDVLILDEPTAGLDPKQIIETRELIKGLAGSHTVVLSTHILPEVSMTCGRVVIINKGRVVAEDTPENLTRRLQGAGTVRLEVRGDEAALLEALRSVPGVLAVHARAPHQGLSIVDVEAEAGTRRARRAGARRRQQGPRPRRPAAARHEPGGDLPPPHHRGRRRAGARRLRRQSVTALRNVAAIFGKEWRHYFGSPIAWVALFVWTMLFGIFFYFSFNFFLEQSMRIAQQGMEYGGGMKISLNEYLIRPLFHNMAVVALFVTPMLTMRLFAEEKRQGTIELLATSPITDWQVVLGKFLAASALYALMILAGLVNVAGIWLYASSTPEWKPVATGALGLLLLGSLLPRDGHLRLDADPEPDRGRASCPSACSSACGRSAGPTTRRPAR